MTDDFRLPEPGEPRPPPPPEPPPPPRPFAAPTPSARRGDAGAPRRRDAGPRAKKKRNPWLFFLGNAIPLGVAIGWFVLPAATRERILSAFPTGVGARVTAAIVCFVVLIVLARLVLPAAHGSIQGLAAALAWFRAQKGGRRALLYPAEMAVGLAWFLAQMLFAIDAALVIAAGLAFLGYVARIARPEWFTFLPG